MGNPALQLLTDDIAPHQEALLLWDLLQIPGQEEGEPWRGVGSGECEESGARRLLLLDTVLRHLSPGSSEAPQRRTHIQDASCG